MSLSLPVPTISPQALATLLGEPDLVLLDASIRPISGAVATTPGPKRALPGARRFDFDGEIRDHATDLPHMLPGPAEFTEHARRLGIDERSALVVYDDVGVYGSPRAWWMFRVFGHTNVAVLDGGLPAWLGAGLPTDPAPTAAPRRGDFTARLCPELLANVGDVLRALGDPRCAVLDARSAGRFSGREGEPRPGLRPGHMPGATNLPFAETLADGRLLPPERLRERFAPFGDRRLVTTCGSGVTACIVALAAEVAGRRDVAVYDGSWAQWGRVGSGLPVTTE